MSLKLTNTNAAYNGHTAGTQCLSRTSGQDAPMADAQRLSRLRRAHSAFRAYGGHTVPFAPTAFPTEAREKLSNRRPSFCIRSEKEKHGI